MSTPAVRERSEAEVAALRVSEYVANYTSGERVRWAEVWAEVKEFAAEVWKRNLVGMREEWGDVLHFAQLWAYWRFKVNGPLWRGSLGSVKKFMDRLRVWQDLYEHVGLGRHVSNFCGNYHKEEKVVKQLGRLGIDAEKAKAAFHAVVQKHS